MVSPAEWLSEPVEAVGYRKGQFLLQCAFRFEAGAESRVAEVLQRHRQKLTLVQQGSSDKH